MGMQTLRGVFIVLFLDSLGNLWCGDDWKAPKQRLDSAPPEPALRTVLTESHHHYPYKPAHSLAFRSSFLSILRLLTILIPKNDAGLHNCPTCIAFLYLVKYVNLEQASAGCPFCIFLFQWYGQEAQ